MSNNQTGEKKQEDGFMNKGQETGTKKVTPKELLDPRVDIISVNRKKKGGLFSNVGR
jgi:hypothetical protein